MVRRLTRSPATLSPASFSTRFQMRAELLERREVPSASMGYDAFPTPAPYSSHPGDVQPAPILPAPSETTVRPLLHEPRGRYAIGTSGGGVTQVNVYDAKTNALLGILNPFGNRSTLGVSVATGDVNGDGVEDVIVASGRYGKPVVKIFDGQTLKEIGSFEAYSTTFTGGVSVAVADVNGDGKADIITGAGVGSAAQVKVFTGAGLFNSQGKMIAKPVAVQNFFAFETSFRGGITVAAGDVNGDGNADIIVGKGAGSTPEVKVFNGANGAMMYDYYALNPNYSGGISVAAGDINGDGRADIIVGASQGPTSQVRVFSGDNLLADYSAFGSSYHGARVATQDIDGDGIREVIVVTGPNSPPRMRVLNGLTGVVRRESPAMPGLYTKGLAVG